MNPCADLKAAQGFFIFPKTSRLTFQKLFCKYPPTRTSRNPDGHKIEGTLKRFFERFRFLCPKNFCFLGNDFTG
jgi:hypothetical protein